MRAANELVRRAERENGVAAPVRLLLNIESPRALREASALACADDRVMGLQVGLGDLFEPLGFVRKEVAAVRQVLFAVRMAAGEAGVDAWDGAWADVRDVDGFRAEARLARRLGFAGKSCIHPSQVALANEAFRPSDVEIEHSLEVIQAAADAEARGIGAAMKHALATWSGDAAWRTVRPPLAGLTSEAARELETSLRVAGFAMPGPG